MVASPTLFFGTAIRCRGLYIPHAQIEEAIAQSVRPLIFENKNNDYRYSCSGSCTLLAYKGTYFVFFTRHQSHMFSPEDIRVTKGSSTSRPFSFDKLYYVDERKDEEYEDIRALRIADQIHKTRAELGCSLVLTRCLHQSTQAGCQLQFACHRTSCPLIILRLIYVPQLLRSLAAMTPS
jgi:hypothetical protein